VCQAHEAATCNLDTKGEHICPLHQKTESASPGLKYPKLRNSADITVETGTTNLTHVSSRKGETTSLYLTEPITDYTMSCPIFNNLLNVLL